MPATGTPTTAPDEQRPSPPTPWAAFIETERLRPRDGHPQGMGNNEFARFLSHDSITSDVVSRWRKGTYGVGPEVAIHVAVRLELPPTLALRAAGYAGMADFFERETARRGDGAAALDVLIAQTRESIPEGLSPAQALRADAVIKQLADSLKDQMMIARIKLEKLAETESETQGRDVS